MCNYTESEILSSIDNVNECVAESALNVFDSIINEFDKLSQFVEFTIFDESVVMEGEVWDYATGKDSLDSGFMKVVKFIPKLLIGIARAVASVFKKDTEQTLDEGAKAATNQLAQINDPNTLAIIQTNVKNASKDNVDFEPKKKVFGLFGVFRKIRNYIDILCAIPPIIKTVRTLANGGKTTYGTLAREIWGIIKGKEAASEETRELAIDAFFTLAKDAGKAARGVAAICSEASSHLEKQLQKDASKGLDVTKKAEIKDLMDSIASTAKIASIATRFTGIGAWIGKHFITNKITKAMDENAFDKEEDVALMNAETKNKELKARIKANKKTAKQLKKNEKRLNEKNAKINALNAKNQALENKLEKSRMQNQVNKDAQQYTHDARWGNVGSNNS